MNRSNIVFGILVLMLAGLTASFVMRARAEHQAPPSPVKVEAAKKPAKAAKKAPTAAAPSASANARPPAPAKPLLDRPLAVTSLDWPLATPGVLQNDGLAVNKKGAFAKKKLELRLSVSKTVSDLQNALARGGADEKGADVALLPLPEFVASYEALKALDPVMFLVVGWSSGRDLVLSELKALQKLPEKDPISVRGEPGTSPMFLAAFALDATGVDLERLEFEAGDAEKPAPTLWALTRQQLDDVPDTYQGNVLLSSGEALQLIPYVAVAQRAFVERSTQALVAFGEVWFQGQTRVSQDPTAASRRVAKLEGGPEPLELLGQLGEMAQSSITDNALSAGVAGRGAVNLTSLFDRCWRYWRTLKVLTTPTPERAPVNGDVITQLVLSNPPGEEPKSSRVRAPVAATNAPARAPLLSLDAGPGKKETADIINEVGFIAGVFARSELKLAIYSQAHYDKKSSEELAKQISERFDLSEGRLTAEQVKPTSMSSYWLDVMPVE